MRRSNLFIGNGHLSDCGAGRDWTDWHCRLMRKCVPYVGGTVCRCSTLALLARRLAQCLIVATLPVSAASSQGQQSEAPLKAFFEPFGLDLSALDKHTPILMLRMEWAPAPPRVFITALRKCTYPIWRRQNAGERRGRKAFSAPPATDRHTYLCSGRPRILRSQPTGADNSRPDTRSGTPR